MSKNHYIPQLWLRQFADGEKINTFNVEEGRFETKKIKNTFYEDDIFSPELEEAFARKLEGPFGDLLNNKLMADTDRITINRKENLLIRKFQMVHFLRSTYSNMSHLELLKRAGELDNPAVQFVESLPGTEAFFPSPEKYISDLEMLMRYDTIEDILQSPEVSPVIKLSAQLEYASYYAIWDTVNAEEEYILPKLPGISLQDKYGPLHKMNAMLEFLKENERKLSQLQRMRFDVIFSNLSGNVENYCITPLSPTRALIGISQYFKGFFPQQRGAYGMQYIPKLFRKNGFDKHFYEPLRMELFEPCENRANTQYTYHVKQLTPHEVQYQNSLALNEEMEEFAFHDYDKIRNSFWAYENVFTMAKKKHDYSKWA